MFSKTAAFYDALYSFKDYRAEADYVTNLIRERVGDGRLSLLDVGCGTGVHIEHLQEEFDCEGVDLDPNLLQIARERNSGLPFHLADMASFDLAKRFDAVICMFSAIGYAKTLPRLQGSIQTFTNHLIPGGIVAVEAWFTPEQWKAGSLHALHIDEPDLKLCRMSKSPEILPGDYISMDMHHLLATPEGVEHFVETHEMGMFTEEQYREAFALAGLKVHAVEGLIGRSIYVGTHL